MTELDAINQMLAAIGEAPVNSVGTGLSESRLAQLQLERTSREVQSVGWYFNTENYKLSPNNKSECQLPRNCLKLDSQNTHYVQRGGVLYDRLRQTTKFNSPVWVTVVLGLEWLNLPETAKRYIVIKAGRKFQADFIGSPTLNQFHAQDEAEAHFALKQEELEAGNYNLFNNPEVASDLRRSSSKEAGSGSTLGYTYEQLLGGYD
ncbi:MULTISPECIES: phage tail protein [unclassified Marinobacter]|uniref:phage tail protein n=1 Tax=unclassified Marinobacter TaxID=83889 RepID=UPI0012686AB8|nr:MULTISPECIES: phage tail protein [unclassified Marinobacter]